MDNGTMGLRKKAPICASDQMRHLNLRESSALSLIRKEAFTFFSIVRPR